MTCFYCTCLTHICLTCYRRISYNNFLKILQVHICILCLSSNYITGIHYTCKHRSTVKLYSVCNSCSPCSQSAEHWSFRLFLVRVSHLFVLFMLYIGMFFILLFILNMDRAQHSWSYRLTIFPENLNFTVS